MSDVRILRASRAERDPKIRLPLKMFTLFCLEASEPHDSSRRTAERKKGLEAPEPGLLKSPVGKWSHGLAVGLFLPGPTIQRRGSS